MNKLLIALALVPMFASANYNTERDIMKLISQAPMARVVCNRLDYSDDCTKLVKDRIKNEMLEKGFDKSEAEACATVSLENDANLEQICATAFNLSEEYEDFLNN